MQYVLKEINKLKKENESLKRTSSEKYFENKAIDKELKFIDDLLDKKKNNSIYAMALSIMAFICTYACLDQITDFYGLANIILLSSNVAAAILVGNKVGNIINDKLLKDFEYNCKTINDKQEELINKKNNNIVMIDNINQRLINNNNIIDRLHNEINNINENSYYPVRKQNNKTKKLTLKKII